MLFTEASALFERHLLNIERSPRTIENYRMDLRLLNTFQEKKYNGPIYLQDITKGDIEEYLLYLKEVKKYQDASRKRMLGTFRSFFRYAYRSEWCEKNIAETLDPINCRQKERHFLSEDEVHVFIEAIDHQLIKLVAETLYYTGMRISECLNLKVEDVDLESNLIYILKGKGNKDRTIPINPKLKLLLNDYTNNWKVPSDYFFATQISGTLSRTNVARIFRETSSKLGLKKTVTAHVMRHSFASNMLKNQVNLVSISNLLGHSDLKTTSIYVHSRMDDLTEAVNTL